MIPLRVHAGAGRKKFMSEELSRKWDECIKGYRDYTATRIKESWITSTLSCVIQAFDLRDDFNIPSEFIRIYINLDVPSLEHLWSRFRDTTKENISVSDIRAIMEYLLFSRLETRLSPAQYTEWVSELLLLLNCEESGFVSKSNFMKLFPLWHASRLWSRPRSQTSIARIENAWNFLDVSSCGVLSQESVNNWLLPFTFRVLMPGENPDIDNLSLRKYWLDLMSSLTLQRKSDWVNHWKEFINIDLSSIRKHLEADSPIEELADQALASLGGPKKHASRLSAMIEFGSSSLDSRVCIFHLWLLSIPHRGRISPILADDLCPAIPVLPPSEIRATCASIWSRLIGDPSTPQCAEWTNSLVSSLLRHTVVLRDEFVSRFLSQEEANQLWMEFAQTSPERIQPHELRDLFIGVYSSLEFDGTVPDVWLVDVWVKQFALFSQSSVPKQSGNLIVSRNAFLKLFPLFFASLQRSFDLCVDPELSAIWPVSNKDEIVFSEIHLRDLLKRVWETIVPAELNMPCQEWWLSRCCERLARKGQAVTRSDFLSLFISTAEVDVILGKTEILDVGMVVQILGRCVHPSEIVDRMQEFYLLTDMNTTVSDPDTLAAVTREAFKVAFPLWLATV